MIYLELFLGGKLFQYSLLNDNFELENRQGMLSLPI
jgi:hypothetical protein